MCDSNTAPARLVCLVSYSSSTGGYPSFEKQRDGLGARCSGDSYVEGTPHRLAGAGGQLRLPQPVSGGCLALQDTPVFHMLKEPDPTVPQSLSPFSWLARETRPMSHGCGSSEWASGKKSRRRFRVLSLPYDEVLSKMAERNGRSVRAEVQPLVGWRVCRMPEVTWRPPPMPQRSASTGAASLSGNTEVMS